ncbi:FCS-Like Zinc finger 6-like [Rhododendron vialii]|uniref:FCS-Like Zinc finger 6-like n=1 Tax=Rhododendron vialii TaxID=182163 RepID=UPI00265F5098|nr:FCS-Like Zinc finger 6-like [Rhododendron vialii]
MMLGKRQRGPIRRTASMKGINVDLNDAVEVSEPSDYPHQNLVINGQAVRSPYDGSGSMVLGGGPSGFDHRVMAMVSPRYNNNNKRSAAGGGGGAVVETAHFLKTCGLCNRRLTAGRDIYMYRGDTAFCSQECREQQMKHDERKEKYSLAASKKDGNHRHHSPPNTATATATSDVGLYIS